MKDKVINGTEKYPSKRGYAIGKLQKFLKLSNLTKKFKANCIKQLETSGFDFKLKGHKELKNAFLFSNSNEGLRFWSQVSKDFAHYCNGNKVFTVYGD